jgi:S-DNA-T family DNA segregation ATPase FtsK/SpoIIIE
MHVIVRTSNEEAELIVRASGADLLLSGLLERVTGQPAPPVVTIDGRAVTTSTPFTEGGVVAGSVLSLLDPSVPGGPDGTPSGVVTLVQIAGTGAGTRVDLEPGEFRIGPGRRVTAPELDFAPVDESAIRVTVQEDGAVLVSDVGRSAWLDGRPLGPGAPAPWTGGLLEVDDRVFALRARHDEEGRPGTTRTVGADGRSPFNRPPRRRSGSGSADSSVAGSSSTDSSSTDSASTDSASKRVDDQPDLDDALRMTTLTNRELWHRRATDPDAFHIAVGLAPVADGEDRRVRTLSVDLQRERGFGIVGGSDFARAAARGLLLQAATGFGPADLDIAVITSGTRLPAWEWVKWLPHATVVDDPQLLSSEAELHAWIRSRAAADRADAVTRGHRTLVVVDEPTRWHGRGSALRALFGTADGAADPFRFVILGGSPEEIPAICTIVLEERRRSGSVLENFSENLRVDDVHAFLPSEHIALDAARRLASLEDPELPPAAHLPREVSLEQLLGLDRHDAGTLAARWVAGRGTTAPTARLGCTFAHAADDGGVPRDGIVDRTLSDGGLELLVAGGADAGTGSFLESLLLGMAIDRQPDDLNYLLFDLTGRAAFTAVADLPHTVGTWVDPSPPVMRRCLRSLRAELAFRRRSVPQPSRLLIALDEAAPDQPGRSEFVAELLEIVVEGAQHGMHLVAATQRQGSLEPSIASAAHRSLLLRFDDTDDVDQAVLPRFVPGRGVLRDAEGVTHLQTPNAFGTTPGARSPHAITPFVIGRDRGAMERRLTRVNTLAPDRSDDPGLTEVVRTLADAAAALGQDVQRRPCPAPLPPRLDLREMLEGFPGDGVPFALEDLPDEQRTAARWWQPGPSGGLAVVGGSASERTDVVLTLALGVAARSSADDVHLYVVADVDHHDEGASRCAALGALPHTAAVIGLDEAARIDAMVQYLDEETTRRADLAERRGGTGRVVSGEPAIAILIDDVGELATRLRRTTEGDGILLDLERVIHDGGPYGICVVVTGTNRRVLPHRLPDELDVLVLRPDDPNELAAFGLEPAHFSEPVAGRALSPSRSTEVQLAAPPDNLSDAIDELRAEPAGDRPPRPIPPDDPAGGSSRRTGVGDDAAR